MITIETMLCELRSDVYSPTATALRKKLKSNLNVAQSLVIRRIDAGLKINSSEYYSARNHLLKNKYIYSVGGNERGMNGKMLNNYVLNPKGELAATEITRVYQPIVDRINAKKETAV